MLAVLLAGICGISAFSQNEFRYIRNDLKTDKCNVYYDMRYYTMDKARCIYYSLAKDITGNNIHEYESQNEIIDEVDDMITDYTEKASYVHVYKDCIPLISQYTNCNRDNICTGCKTCNCDSEGRWNCSLIQRCRPDPVISLNHHTLVIVMESLNDTQNTLTHIRSKRSLVDGKEKEIMGPEEVLDWMYGVKTFNTDEDFKKTVTEVNSNSIKINNAIDNRTSFPSFLLSQNEKKDFNETESQPLVFEDLLNDLYVNDNKNHVSLEDKSSRYKNIIYEFEPPNSLNEITSSLITDTTILEDNIQKNKSDADSIIDDVFAYIDSDINEHYNYKRDINYNTQRLEKTDVDLHTMNITFISNNNTDKILELQNILHPLNNVVHQRQEELNKLNEIREKLINYTKSFSNININNSITNISNENITRLYFIQLNSVQNFDDFRKRDLNILNKYLEKLKRDIHEVVSDIAGIQRISNSSAIPYDLKTLIRAMKNYVTKENKRKKIVNHKNIIDLRKKFDTDISFKTDIKPIDEIIKILEVLDNDMPTFNVLDSLTPDTRKILTRIINTFYKTNTATTGSLNTNYNLIGNLEGIGKHWNEMTTDIATNSLSERLYSMRLFYLVLSLDIKIMEDTLAVLKFAENRRMTLINDVTGERLIDRIGNDLNKSMRRFHHVIQIQTQRSRANNTASHGYKLSKKKSFLQHIKTLLKNSKMDIRKLFHRKVPKSEIVKRIAKKKMDEIRKNKFAEYEQTMQSWQTNLNIISRNKRSAGTFQNFINSIKRLFPGNRKRNKKIRNKTEKVGKRSTKRGHKKEKKIISTTPKMKITTQ